MLDKLFLEYAGSDNDWIKNAIRGQLFDVLRIEIIAYLMAYGEEKISDSTHREIRSKYHVEIRKAIEEGKLKGTHINQHKKYVADCVHKNYFKQWLIEKNEWPINNNLLKFWWDESEIDKEVVEAKALGKSPRKKHETRNIGICFECNCFGAVPLDSQGYIILNDKGDRDEKHLLKEGAGWHKGNEGVYFIVGEKYSLSPSTIEGIYNSPENTQHRKFIKHIKLENLQSKIHIK